MLRAPVNFTPIIPARSAPLLSITIRRRTVYADSLLENLRAVAISRRWANVKSWVWSSRSFAPDFVISFVHSPRIGRWHIIPRFARLLAGPASHALACPTQIQRPNGKDLSVINVLLEHVAQALATMRPPQGIAYQYAGTPITKG